MYLFANETPAIWDMFLAAWSAALQPRNDAEVMVVEDIAHAQWNLRRSRTYESGLMDTEMERQLGEMASLYNEPLDEGTRLAAAFKALSDDSRSLDQLNRYEIRARRAVKIGLATLKQLREIANIHTQRKQPQPAGGGTTCPAPRLERVQQQPPAATQKPAAQQLAPENRKVQNEIERRCRPYVPAARRAAIQRAREAFGNRVPIKMTLPHRLRRP